MNNDNGLLLFLGTGSSMGVPIVGCGCAVCQSASPRNKRLRPSALLKINGKAILIDAGPDFRTQALTHSINKLDGVILTHAHHDHTAGVDDLRVFYMWTGQSLPCLLSSETAEEIGDRYKYIFSKTHPSKKLVSKISLHIMPEEKGEIEFLNETFRYFSYRQAGMKVNGLRFGNLGFVSDIREYSDSIFEDLKGIEKLVISALRFEKSTFHFSIEEAVHFSKNLGSIETWLTHVSHDVDHEIASQSLPKNVFIAYDGLSINFRM